MSKPISKLVRTRIEVSCLVRGKPSYKWVDGLIVFTPEGHELQPHMRINVAKKFCRDQGWDYVVMNK